MSDRRTAILAGGVIVLATLTAYCGSFSAPFVFDDIPAIAGNPSLRHLWPIWGALRPPSANGVTVGGRPVLNLSLAVNYAVSGMGGWSYHALNLLIHILAGLTLFGVMRRTLRWSALSPTRLRADSAAQRVGDTEREARRWRGEAESRGDASAGSPWGEQRHNALHLALAVALLWTLHPLQTESVIYVVQRAESLMGLFYLLTLYCFIRGVDADEPDGCRGGARCPQRAGSAAESSKRVGDNALHLGGIWFALSVAACLLGMGTKEVMVSAPVIVFLYDRTFLAGSFREAWRRRWRVYAGLAATWIVLFFLVRSTHGRGGTSGFGSGVSWWTYALTQFPAIVHYLKLAAWPHPLVFDYGTEWVANAWTVAPEAAVVIALVVATGWALFRSPIGVPPLGGRRPPSGDSASEVAPRRPEVGGHLLSARPALGFLGAWFFAILAPTSLIPGNRQTSAEHRMYLALIPVIVLVVVGIYRLLDRRALPVCLILTAGLAAITARRNEVYRSALALWSDTAIHQPGNPFAHDNLGNILEEIPGRLTEAIVQYQETLRLKPDHAVAHYNLGNALQKTPARWNDAIVQYREALRLNPGYASAHDNLGSILAAEGRKPEAIAEYQAALRLKPDDPEAHNNLGNALRAEGRTPEAIAQFEAALRLKPDYAKAHYNLGNALNTESRGSEAIAQYEEAVRLKPDYVEALNNLSISFARLGRFAEAAEQCRLALRINPHSPSIHNNYGNILAQLGQFAEARAQYEQALRIDPHDENARTGLARLPQE